MNVILRPHLFANNGLEPVLADSFGGRLEVHDNNTQADPKCFGFRKVCFYSVKSKMLFGMADDSLHKDTAFDKLLSSPTLFDFRNFIERWPSQRFERMLDVSFSRYFL
jgi:hypothetical protein